MLTGFNAFRNKNNNKEINWTFNEEEYTACEQQILDITEKMDKDQILISLEKAFIQAKLKASFYDIPVEFHNGRNEAFSKGDVRKYMMQLKASNPDYREKIEKDINTMMVLAYDQLPDQQFLCRLDKELKQKKSKVTP